MYGNTCHHHQGCSIHIDSISNWNNWEVRPELLRLASAVQRKRCGPAVLTASLGRQGLCKLNIDQLSPQSRPRSTMWSGVPADRPCTTKL
eukprot:2865697-Amphidinium_carterae.1